MNNLTHQLNFHFGLTHAVNHHRFRMIGRLQTLSNPTTPSSWIPMSIICSNCGRICRTVGVICSKRKNWLFWWLKFYTYFTYIGKWQQPTTIPWRANVGEIYVLRDEIVLMFMNARLFKELCNLVPKLWCRRPHRSAPMTWSFSLACLHTH